MCAFTPNDYNYNLLQPLSYFTPHRLLFPQSQAEVLSLIGDSLDNWRTKQYDWYQERTNNIQL